MKIRKEPMRYGETIIFDYQKKHLQAQDRERIVSAYKEHRAALPPTEECRRQSDSGLQACLACISRELCWLIDQAEIRALQRELAKGRE